MKTRCASWLAAAALVSMLVGNSLVYAEPVQTDNEQTLFDLTNVDRASAGVQLVAFDGETLDIARGRAATEISTFPLSHYDDDSGQFAFARILGSGGLLTGAAGENLARTTVSTTIAIVAATLMRSALHRAVILNPIYSHLSIGVALSQGWITFAEIFRE